ncbi:hypothetical protein JCM10213_005585 [Rhodosporidiobolus nylandii]
MPNPPTPQPPHPSNAPSPAPTGLRKFSLIQPPPANAPILAVTGNAGPASPHDLAQLRGSLILSRVLAVERLSMREGNKAQLAERQRISDEQARVKDAERKKKREEDERKERERVEKVERERAEREREERKRAKQAEKDEEDRRKGETVAREVKQKQRALDVISLVQKSEAKRRPGADGDGDIVMGDGAASSYAATPSSAFPTPPPVSKLPSKARAVQSPDPDDEPVQPKPPRHHDKKKRKREHIIDSDASDSETPADHPTLQKLRKLGSQGSPSDFAPSSAATPTPAPAYVPPPPPQPDGVSIIERKLKEERFQKHSIPIKPPPAGGASAFYVPSTSLVPPKPPVVPPIPTPKRQADVSGDFSIAKPGQQIAHSTFQNWVDAYLRPFGEDDLAFLAAKPEDVTPYLIPPLGKNYLDQWEEEDADPSTTIRPSHAHPANYHNPSLEPPPLPRLRPDMLSEDALAMESVFLGPLSERLMAALAIEQDSAATIEGEDDELRVGRAQEGPVPPKLQLDAVDLEERIKRELRFIGILPEEEVDWSAREDDEISSSLRACQRLLHQQTELNEARKSVLMSLVKDRMAYQDYETARDAQERVIEAGWTKRTRVDTKKAKKKKDRDRRAGGNKEAAKDAVADQDPSKQPIPLELLEAVEKRNRLVQAFQPFFEEEEKGRYYGLPERSVYDGLEVGEEDDEDDEQSGLAVAGPSHQQQIAQ